MRPRPSSRRVVAVLTAIVFASAGSGCTDTASRPTGPDGRRVRFDVTGDTTSTYVAVDSTAVDSTAADTSTTTTTTSGDSTTYVAAPADTTGTDTTSVVALAPPDTDGTDLTARPVQPQLLVCPTSDQVSAQAVIGPEGGSVEARGTTLTIPAGAVAESTLFEVVVPASNYMETEIHAVGVDHYVFLQPATITINYARCPDGALPETSRAQGAYIETGSHKILELMGGTDDRSGHKVSFLTGHLSGYVVAY
jgi:hypothetical protein